MRKQAASALVFALRLRPESSLIGLRLGLWKGVSTLLLIGAGSLLLMAEGSALQGPASARPEDVLKLRAEQFYSLLLSNRLADAEAYVAQDSVENFRRLSNNPFFGFHVETVHLDPEGKGAEVETTILFMVPLAPRPLPFRRKSSWRLESGEWRFVIPDVAPPTLDAVYSPSKTLESGTVAPPVLQFREDQINLGVVYTDEKKQVRFSFTNISDHPVRISEVETGCRCLRATKEDKMYRPGEAGEVAIEFDPTGYRFFYKQTVVVKTEPGGHNHLLLIEAQVLPPESRPAE